MAIYRVPPDSSSPPIATVGVRLISALTRKLRLSQGAVHNGSTNTAYINAGQYNA